MSRRKQLKPKQVQDQEDSSSARSGEKLVRTSELHSPSLLFENPVSSQSFDRQQLQTRLLKEVDRSRFLSRKKKESGAENPEFFSGGLFTNQPMYEDERSEREVDSNQQQPQKETVMEEGLMEKYSLTEQINKATGNAANKDLTEENTGEDLSLNDDQSLPSSDSPREQEQERIDKGLTENVSSQSAIIATESTSVDDTTKNLISSNRSEELSSPNQSNDLEMDPNADADKSTEQSLLVNNVVRELTERNQVSLNKLLENSPDSEKENLTSEKMLKMINRSRSFLGKRKPAEDSADKNRQLEEINDKVEMLQQQHMYTVQMLNYLQFQLNVMANNSQSQPKLTSGSFPPNPLNGFSLQGVPNLLAVAASMTGPENQNPHPQTNNFFPSVAAAINPQLSSNKTHESPQNAFASTQNFKTKSYEQNKSLNSDCNSNQFNHDGVAYNPLSSLAMLQNSSKIRSNPSEVLAKQNLDAIESEESLLKHVCRFCQKIFGSDSALQIHLRSHTGERPFKCNICANRFSTKGNLKVHFVRHKEKYPHIEMNPNPVPEYLDNIPTSSGLPHGMSVMPDVSNCHDENSEVSEDIAKTSPAEKHSVELPNPYRCLDNRQNHNDNFNLNKESNHEVENRKIFESFSENSLSPKLQDHSLYFQENKDAQNREKSSAAVEKLNNSNEESTSATSSSMFVPTSSKFDTGKTSSEFQGDLRTQQSMASESDSILSSETTKLQQLVEQIDKGKELEKNECHVCHRILSCQSALKLHYRTHTGERPYKCDLCSRAFTTRGNLRTHYSSVHRQQLQSSSNSDNLGSRGNPLQCPMCGSRFMEQQAFQQHIQIHLYMHNQQQAFQLMNGQMSSAGTDFRMLNMMNGRRVPNISLERQLSRNEGQADISNSDNDEVFDENLSDGKDYIKNESKERDSPVDNTNVATFSYALPSTRNLNPMTNVSAFSGDIKKVENRENLERGIAKTNDKERQVSDTSEEAVLDLSRPSSNSSSSTSEVKTQFLQTAHSAGTNQPRITPTNNSLSALASMATNQNAMMQVNGSANINLPVSSFKDEARARRMTTVCEICNKPFTCQSALEIHRRSHTKERPFACCVCERGFTTKGNLKQHLLTHNITDVDDEMLEPVVSPLNGTLSSQSPPSSSSVQNQQTFNHLKRPLEALACAPPPKKTNPRHWCEICQKQFSSASSLQIHNRTHTGEKPFACNFCGRAFTTKGNLKVHMGTHVWGAGGSRRGRRISMDNPLISPYMQNTSNSSGIPLRPRVPPQLGAVPEQAAIYHQYAAALASGMMNNKASGDPSFQGNPVMNLNNAAKLLMSNNFSVSSAGSAPLDEKKPDSGAIKDQSSSSKSVAQIASEWFWNVYTKKSQEQGVN